MSRARALVWVLAAFPACLDFDGLLNDCRAGRTCDGGAPADAGAGPDAGADAGGAARDGGADCDRGGRGTVPAGAGAVAFCFNGFTWENPLPHGTELKTVWGAAPDDVWAAGDSAMVMHWDGRRWTSHQGSVSSPPGAGATINRVIGGTPGTFLFGTVAPSRLMGTEWTALTAADGWDILDAVMAPSGPLLARGSGELLSSPPEFSTVVMRGPAELASGSAGTVLDDGVRCALSGLSNERQRVWTCDGGLGWSVDAGALRGRGGPLWADARGLHLAAADGLWRLEDDGGVSRTTVTSVTYHAVSPTGANRLLAGTQCAIADTLGARHAVTGCNTGYTLLGITTFEDGGSWAVGEAGALVRQTGATQWSLFSQGFVNDLFALAVDDTSVTFAGSNGALIDRASRMQRSAGSAVLRDVVRLEGSRVLVASEDFNLYEVANNQTTVYSGVVGQELHGLSAGPDESWAVGTNVFVGKTDGGWRAEQPPFAVPWWKLARSGSFIVAVGEQSSVAWRTVGGNWRGEAGPDSDSWYGVWSDAPMKAWVVGGGPSILRYEASPDGGTFQPATLPVASGTLFDVWGFGADDVWAVGEDGLAFHYDGTGWSLVEVGTRAWLERVRGRRLPDGTRELFIVGRFGTVLRTRY